MKKSFMTRVLATGLSLAMAFSLSAATNVSVASAAAKPAMKSSKMTVKVGQKKNYQATAATQKAYKITKVKMSAAGKTKAKVTVNSSKKSIKVEGLAATKGSNVIISFKNNKTKKTTKVTTKVVVKEVATKQAIVKAEATGVKTITLTMAKEVASVESPVEISVKKGSGARTIKSSVAEGKTITLTMDAKLIAGDYTVTVKGLEDEDLTATVAVAKDETLTSYYVSEQIIQKNLTETTKAYIYYAALNQYGEKMAANRPTVSCTFGKVNNALSTTATANANGVIQIEDIPAILSIQGTEGQVVLVDGTYGVTTTATVKFSAPATTSTVKLAGLYNMSKAVMKDITEKDNIANYKILFTAQDQYGNDLDSNGVLGLSATVAGGITNVEVVPATNANVNPEQVLNYFSDVVVDGKEYIALALRGTANTNGGRNAALAGSYTLTLVNKYKGLLATETFNVVDYTVIKSVNVTSDGVLYNNEDNTLNYEITDSDGNSVTSYATLYGTVTFKNYESTYQYVKWVKQADGTAKLVAKPKYGSFNYTNDDKKETTLGTFVANANESVSTNFLIKTFTLTIGEDREVTGLTGVKSTVATAYAKDGGEKKIALGDILAADQYGNPVAKADKIAKFPQYFVMAGNMTGAVKSTAVTGVSIYSPSNTVMTIGVTGSAINSGNAAKSGSAILLTPHTDGTAVVYLKYYNAEISAMTGNRDIASATNYDAKLYLTVTNTDKNVSNENLKIKSVNEGYAKKATADTEVTLNNSDIKVVSSIGGQEVVIPSGQYVITGYENNKITDTEAKNGTNTKTAKVKIRVTTHDSNTNINAETDLEAEYTISTLDAKVDAIKDTNDVCTSTGGYITTSGTFNKNDFVNMFKYNTQYNNFSDGVASGAALNVVSGGATTIANAVKAFDGIKYSINVENKSTHSYTISNDGTNAAKVEFAGANAAAQAANAKGAIIKVTATVGSTSKTYTFTVM